MIDPLDAELEHRVEVRAAELAQALEAERTHRVLLQDRQRLAADLHDLVIQRLYACQLAMAAMPAGAFPDLRERVIDDLDEAIKQLRACIYELKLSADTTPLTEQMRLIVDAAERSMQTEFEVSGAATRMPELVANQVVAVTREAVSNVVRHADAHRLRVHLAVDEHAVRLTVTDDGDGIPHGAPLTGGVANMKLRAEALGGHCDLRPHEGGGTALFWEVPLV